MTEAEKAATEQGIGDDELKTASSLEDMTEDFTGNELDEESFETESQIHGDELDDKENASVPKNEPPMKAGSVRRPRRTRLLILMIAGICLCFLGGAGVLYLFATLFKGVPGSAKERPAVTTYRIVTAVQEEAYSIALHPFIIPYENKAMNYTYVSLNISIEVANETYRQGILHEKEALRAVIYDRLIQEIHPQHEMPSMENLKNLIFNTVNDAMAVGQVRQVYITNFLIV